MSDLLVLLFESRQAAEGARDEFMTMELEHLLQLEDSVVAYKEGGEVKLEQSLDLTTFGSVTGATLGLLVGVIASIPFGGALLPIFATVFGGGLGALSGALSDFGISDPMMRAVVEGFEEGKAALFILAHDAHGDEIAEHLHGFEAEILHSSFPEELNHKLRQVVHQVRSQDDGPLS